MFRAVMRWFCPAGRAAGGVQSLFAAGVEHPYLGCTLVGASLLVAMCKLRHTSGKVTAASRVTSCAYFQSKKNLLIVEIDELCAGCC